MVCLDLDHPDIEDVRQLESARRTESRRHGRGHQAPPQGSAGAGQEARPQARLRFQRRSLLSPSAGRTPTTPSASPTASSKPSKKTATGTSPAAPTARSPRPSRPATCGSRSPSPPGAAPTPACSTTTRSTSGTPARKSGRINASNPCVTGDTRVLTPGGIWRRIDQMIHLPARVITNLDGQEIHVTDGAFPTGTKEVFELRTAGGYTLKLTADHKVWTRIARLGRSARISPPTTKCRLPSQPAAVQEIGEPQDPQFFQTARPVPLRRQRRRHRPPPRRAASPTHEHVDALRPLRRRELGRPHATPTTTPTPPMIDGDATPTATRNTLTATLTNRRLLSRLSAFVRTDDGQRRLSDEAFTAGLAAQKHLLRALFTADAKIIEQHPRTPPRQPRPARRRPTHPARLRRPILRRSTIRLSNCPTVNSPVHAEALPGSADSAPRPAARSGQPPLFC